MKIDLEQIRSLLNVVGETDVTELTIENGEEKITIKKQTSVVATTLEMPMSQPLNYLSHNASPIQTQNIQDQASTKVKEDENNGNGLLPITSPMVGTFYRASSPTAAPFVDIGDIVSPGQTICIIEAMKLMNDMPAEISGRVVKVCVENGSTVEYGQTLFMVNPKA